MHWFIHICTHINKYNGDFQQIFLMEDYILLLMVQEKIRFEGRESIKKASTFEKQMFNVGNLQECTLGYLLR